MGCASGPSVSRRATASGCAGDDAVAARGLDPSCVCAHSGRGQSPSAGRVVLLRGLSPCSYRLGDVGALPDRALVHALVLPVIVLIATIVGGCLAGRAVALGACHQACAAPRAGLDTGRRGGSGCGWSRCSGAGRCLAARTGSRTVTAETLSILDRHLGGCGNMLPPRSSWLTRQIGCEALSTGSLATRAGGKARRATISIECRRHRLR